MIIEKELLDKLHEAISMAGGCSIQHTGWTCGTCFFSISEKLDNTDWQTVLAVRGDTKREDLDNLPEDIEKNVKRIIKIAEEK